LLMLENRMKQHQKVDIIQCKKDPFQGQIHVVLTGFKYQYDIFVLYKISHTSY
jgi:hypothetical protein